MTDLRVLKQVLNRTNTGVLLDGFERRRSDLAMKIRKAGKAPSENAIHKMRVASRRFLAMADAFEIYLSRKETGPSRRLVSGCLKGLGEMRDVHVHIVATGELLKDFPQLSDFLDDLTARERALERDASSELARFGIANLLKRTDELVERFVERAAGESDQATHARIAGRVGKAYERVLERRAEIDPEWPRSIHRMRVAFKKFRYTAEIAAPLFDQISPQRLEAMQEFQTRMGRIQDLDTLLETMMAYRERSGRTSLLVPENELRRQRRARIREFIAAADEVRFFWGASESSSGGAEAQVSGDAR